MTVAASIGTILNTTQGTSVANAAECSEIYTALPSFLTSRVERNKAVYQQVAQEKGVPWEVLAAIHYRETNNSRVNPANNQGIYQLYSIYATNSAYAQLARSSNGAEVSEANFLEQTRFAADFIQGKAQASGTSLVAARKLTTNETNISLIKNTLFSYNGRALAYANQAASYGFSSTAQPYEGSPYVMNMFDCQRSAMKIITCDGCSNPTATDTRYGAFTVYSRLKSDNYWLSLIKKPLPQCTPSTVDCIWEFENEDTGKRFYTNSPSERDTVYRLNYQAVGIPIHTRKGTTPGSIPVYRLFHLVEGWHFWTSSEAEKNALVASGKWRDEGIGFHVDPTESNTGKQVYRLYTTNGGGKHVLTTDSNQIKTLLSKGYTNEGAVFTSVSAIDPPPIPTVGYENIYRFQLKRTHFWTTSIEERDALIKSNIYEGVAWETPITSSTPTYRLYSPEGVHFWTKSTNEKSILLKSGWRDEGIAWNAGDTEGSIFRLYDNRAGRHFWTASSNERDILKDRSGWILEGEAWKQK